MNKTEPKVTTADPTPVKTEGKSTIAINRENYIPSRTAAGAKSLSNGDLVAKLLEGMTSEMLYDIADKAFKENEFREKYGKLNSGMQRMNLGNRLRGFVANRDKANANIKEGEKPKATGIEALTKWCAPHRKVVTDITKKAEADKESKKAETAKAKKDVR